MKRITIFCCLSILASCSQQDPIKPLITGKEGKPMPAITMQLTDSTSYFNTASIQQGNPTVLFYFSPTCPYCRLETRRIIRNLDKLKDVRFCFISHAPLSQIKKYSESFGIEGHKNVLIGRDTSYAVYRYFRNKKVPFIAVYGSNKELRNSYLGTVNKDQLLAFTRL